MKVIALDYGEQHIGVAMTDDSGELALRHSTIAQAAGDVVKQVQTLVTREGVVKLIVGVPRNLEGEETAQSEIIRTFVDGLRAHISGVSIETIDETLTSVEAEENLKREEAPMSEVHAEAARIMLEDYLRGQQ